MEHKSNYYSILRRIPPAMPLTALRLLSEGAFRYPLRAAWPPEEKNHDRR
jgi:hypothetical protein